jgi:hypothetical protein
MAACHGWQQKKRAAYKKGRPFSYYQGREVQGPQEKPRTPPVVFCFGCNRLMKVISSLKFKKD